MNIEAPDNFGDTDRVRAARAKLNLALQSVEGDVPANFDLKNAFLVYAAMAGDAEKTAAALGISLTSLQRLVVENAWDDRIAGLIKLRKSGNAQAVERGLNRALNWTQCQRFRIVLERLIRRLYDMTDDELMEYGFASVTTTHKDGSETVEKKFSARPFADLSSALEKVQNLSYQALADTAQERKTHQDRESGPTEQEIHSTIAAAMAKMNGTPPGPVAQAVETVLAKQV